MDHRDQLALIILRDALDTTAGERDSFLSERCGADTALRDCVDALLRGIAADDCDEMSADRDDDVRRSMADALPGTLLGPFRVMERIGRGGMGVVYRGIREDSDFNQEVALKLIRRGFDFDDVHARFLRERRILSRLSHPNLARFIDGGVAADGRPWFALEFVRGESITRWCDANTQDVRERVTCFLNVCAAVQYAHTQLIVHRDLKPGNILVDSSGAVRLLDFGIARLLGGDEGDGSMMTTIGIRPALTPEYAAPEQFGGDAVGVAVDVYSLGVILYELVSGVLPYALDRSDAAGTERTVREMPPQSLVAAIGRTETTDEASTTQMAQRLSARSTTLRAYRAEVRGDLSRIIDKALAKEPERRYGSVEAFREDLARWLAGAPVRATGNALTYRVGKFLKRNRAAVGVAAVLTMSLVVALGFALQRAHEAQLQRDRAIAESSRSDAVREYISLMFRNAADSSGDSQMSARTVLKQGADTIFSRFKSDPATGQTTALMLADLYNEVGDTDGAEPLLRRLVDWPGIEHNPEVLADARALLALVISLSSGKTPDARTLLNQAQAYWLSQPQRYANRLNVSRRTQAIVEGAEGHPDVAVHTLEQAISERKILTNSPDIELVGLWEQMYQAHTDIGNYGEGLVALNQAIALRNSMGLQNSQGMLSLLASRALTAALLGKIDEPIADLRHVIEVRERLYGPSPSLGTARSYLSDVLYRRGDYAESVLNAEQALEITKRYGGADSNQVYTLQSKLAERYLAIGRVADALPMAESGLRGARAQYGDHGLYTGNAYRARARVLAASHRLVEARADLAAARAVYTAVGPSGEAFLARLDAVHGEFEDPKVKPKKVVRDN